MDHTNITIEEFQEVIKNICSRDTSADPDHWFEENPTWGHCAVVSLLAQDQFGGTLVRHSFENIPELEYIRSHYTNMLPGGKKADFTRQEFQGNLPADLPQEERPRERVLSYPDTQQRYRLIKARYEAYLDNVVARKGGAVVDRVR